MPGLKIAIFTANVMNHVAMNSMVHEIVLGKDFLLTRTFLLNINLYLALLPKSPSQSVTPTAKHMPT